MTRVLAVDADDVTLDFSGRFRECIHAVTGVYPSVKSRSWDLSDRYQLDNSVINAAWNHFHNNAMWHTLKIKNKSDEAIKLLQDNGYEIHIVTALNHELKSARESNLLMCGINNVEIHCTGHETSKIEVFKSLKPLALFDDGHHNHHDALVAGIPHRILIENELDPPDNASHTQAFDSLFDAVNWFLSIKNDIKIEQSHKVSI